MMSVNQNKLSSPLNVAKMGALTLFFFAYIVFVSSDAGVALIYVFVFLSMAFVGGVSIIWFAIGIGLLAISAPVVIPLLPKYQYDRIMMFFDPTIDPDGTGIRWQTTLSMRYIQNGGIAGQGLYNGTLVSAKSIPAQHTDFIFSAIAEEMGILGCIVVLLLLGAVVFRCVYVGVKSGNYLNRMICIGIAGMLMFQIFVNVGMCVGLFPVIGLTLPFISYGGSSIITLFAAMGLVSSVKMQSLPSWLSDRTDIR